MTNMEHSICANQDMHGRASTDTAVVDASTQVNVGESREVNTRHEDMDMGVATPMHI